MRSRLGPALEVGRTFSVLVPLSTAAYVIVETIRLVFGGGKWQPPATGQPTLTLDILQGLGLLVALTALLVTVTVMIVSRWKRIRNTRRRVMQVSAATDLAITEMRVAVRNTDAEWETLKSRLALIRDRVNALESGRTTQRAGEPTDSRKSDRKDSLVRLVRKVNEYFTRGIDFLEYRTGSWFAWR